MRVPGHGWRPPRRTSPSNMGAKLRLGLSKLCPEAVPLSHHFVLGCDGGACVCESLIVPWLAPPGWPALSTSSGQPCVSVESCLWDPTCTARHLLVREMEKVPSSATFIFEISRLLVFCFFARWQRGQAMAPLTCHHATTGRPSHPPLRPSFWARHARPRCYLDLFCRGYPEWISSPFSFLGL